MAVHSRAVLADALKAKSTGVVGSVDSGAVGVVADAEDAMEVVAFACYAGVVGALSADALEGGADPDNSAPTGGINAVSAACICCSDSGNGRFRRISCNGWHIVLLRIAGGFTMALVRIESVLRVSDWCKLRLNVMW